VQKINEIGSIVLQLFTVKLVAFLGHSVDEPSSSSHPKRYAGAVSADFSSLVCVLHWLHLAIGL